jgi:hypothetical protein
MDALTLADELMKNLDLIRFDWLAKQIGVKVEFIREDFNLSATDIPWRITLAGMNPVAGRTLRIAVDKAMKLQAKTIRVSESGRGGDC